MQVPAPVPPVLHSFLSISLESWLTILAILLGPFSALLLQRRFDKNREEENRRLEILREKENRRVRIFCDLMSTRGTRLSGLYVQALNGIETEFYGETRVIETWHTLSDHLNTPPAISDDAGWAHWNTQVIELLTDLLYEMGESLGYHIPKVTIKKGAYAPKGWETVEQEKMQLRQAAIQVFEGHNKLKVEVSGEPAPPAVGLIPPIRPPQ